MIDLIRGSLSAAQRRKTAVILLAITFQLTLPLSSQAADDTEVSVITTPAERKPVSNAQEFVGRIDAPEKVAIRARVKGVLEEVLFQEGDTIKAGTPLYRIEKSLFDADVQQAVVQARGGQQAKAAGQQPLVAGNDAAGHASERLAIIEPDGERGRGERQVGRPRHGVGQPADLVLEVGGRDHGRV